MLEAVLWFCAGYWFHKIFSMFYKMGTGVRLIKVAEIRSLECLAQARTFFDSAVFMLDKSAEKIGDTESVKLFKNEIRHEQVKWQNDTAEILKESMGKDFKSFRQWETWDEAMAYLQKIKTNEKLFTVAMGAENKGRVNKP